MSTVSMMTTMSDETASVNSLTLDPEAQPSGPEEVLVIPLGNDPECPGMMSEQKVRCVVKYMPICKFIEDIC
ncbi:hypothetical protein DPMN_146357 [Dreissena polymorpha]|uniref:Uncharacterized protein n=1 Tax=Dreissena polymorpha TaxID=45954 RepID=A0A9D4J209_DREPO|nr:hypothetical protein DPMN_146357 [Dreissena polymorpha]